MRIRFLLILIAFMFILSLNESLNAQSGKQVEIIRADALEFDEAIGVDAKRLIGNVVFKHEEAFMFCDSAYFYDVKNYIQAFSNVRIIQGDSLLLFGQRLFYDGNTKIAQMRDSVILKHYNAFLVTDSLDYDRNTEIGYYFEGGKIFDGDNRLSSYRGYYHSLKNTYYAVDSVLLYNPQYTIHSDTLKYNTDNAIAYFYGPTHIISDSNFIYCENGYYDTNLDLAGFSKNAWLKSGPNLLMGDSLFYDRNIRFGEAFENVSIYDSVENVTAYGNYGYYYEDPQFAMLTDSVIVVYIVDEDSLFLSSDTVYISVDSLEQKQIRAFYKVQVYKSDLQARCDSLVYSSADSVAEMFFDPILWSDGAQITADFISLHFDGEDPTHAILDNNAFVIEKVDSLHYHQIKGNKMIAYFRDKEIYKVDVNSNSQTLYFVIEEDTGDLVALNKVISTNMTIYIENQQIEKIWFYEKPDGETLPIADVRNEQLHLKGYKCLDFLRPKSKMDIFIWISAE